MQGEVKSGLGKKILRELSSEMLDANIHEHAEREIRNLHVKKQDENT